MHGQLDQQKDAIGALEAKVTALTTELSEVSGASSALFFNADSSFTLVLC